MKKLLLILTFFFCFISCAAQKTEPQTIYRVNAMVDRIDGDETTLYTASGNIYATTVAGLTEKKKYTFWIEISEGVPGNIIKATIVKFSLTVGQAQQDLNAVPKELSNRTIIKL